MKKNRILKFRALPLNEQGFKLLAMGSRAQVEVLDELSVKEIVDMMAFLDEAKSTRVVRHLGIIKRNRVLKKLAQNLQEKIQFLFKFNPKSAAGLMSLDYVEVDKAMRIEDLFKVLKQHERKTGKIPTVLATEKGLLIGEIPVRHLLLSNRKKKVDKLVHRVPHIHYNEDENRVIDMFKHHPHGKVVVLDENKSIIGVVYTDDILPLLQKQSSTSLGKFAGINVEEDICDGPMVKVKYRYKWLIINMFTAFLAAMVVGLFEGTISQLVVLAAYLPIVAGMGGNAATQTLAVTVRGIALGEIDEKNARKVIKNEMIAGVVNGVITGILAAGIAILFNENVLLGFVLAFAMVFNLLIAGFFGTLIPLVMKRLGKDPASSATIFITTATDVFGFLAFLGLATLILV